MVPELQRCDTGIIGRSVLSQGSAGECGTGHSVLGHRTRPEDTKDQTVKVISTTSPQYSICVDRQRFSNDSLSQ